MKYRERLKWFIPIALAVLFTPGSSAQAVTRANADKQGGAGVEGEVHRSAEPAPSRVVKDTSYKTGPDLSDYEQARCKLDLYLPEGKPACTVVWFYGGGLESGSKERPFSTKFAAILVTHGIAVAIADYRLSPEVSFPAYVDDAAAAVAWTLQHISEYGGDPGKIVVMGHSAGAYLTAMVGYDPQYLAKYGVSTDAIAGLIPISPQVLTHFTVRKERGVPNPRVTPVIDDAAPLRHVRKDAPPTLVLVAGNDMPTRLEECQYFVALLRSIEHPSVSLLVVPERSHGSIVSKMSEPDDPGLAAVLEFIQANTQATSADSSSR